MTADQGDRYDRQIQLFGAEGQECLSKAKVAVLGLGGLGSHVCQQLAYLGVRNFVIVDGDDATSTSMNRLIGAYSADVGDHKTRIMDRLIKTIQPGAVITAITENLPHSDIHTALADGVNLVFGCFDHDLPRLQTTGLTSNLCVPYIDSATDTHRGDDGSLVYGGHVKVSGIERGCLFCMGMLDQEQIRIAKMDPQERTLDARSYGVPVESLLKTGPSVVTLNGVVASLAVTEALMILTCLRAPRSLQKYYGHSGIIVTSNDTPSTDCGYCEKWGL